MPTITLNGCAPVPLAHYLKALGILRLVSEQADANATAHWVDNQFFLTSRFESEPLLSEFFLHKYHPTPIAVPWSGGDFFAVKREKPARFFEKTPTSSSVIEAIMSVSAERVEKYQDALRATFSAMDRAGVAKKKDIEGSGGPQRRMKAEMLKSLRNSLPDEALAWMDAAAIIEPDAVAFNALLGGGGGSDGNSHFSDNFMQCLWMALPEFDVQRTKPVKVIGKDAVFNSLAALDESLFGTQGAGTKIPDLSPVLFDSTRVGGANQTSGFEAKAGSNPWDFILMLEGAVLFAGSIGRKLDDQREPSARFPFLFQASPVGLGSSYLGESAGRELWLPLWSQHASLAEIRALLAEGRVEKHGRMAKRGTDAFVAAAQLGFDRGITSFQRTGFFKGRIGGDNYFTAIDQGRITPHRNPKVDLLRDIDEWLTKLNSATSSDKCPASVASATVVLERRIADLAATAQNSSSDQILAVLTALGSAERALSKSFKWAESAYLRPLHGLRACWLIDADNKSPEFRLAQSLAGTHARLGGEMLWFRQHLEPLKRAEHGEGCHLAWTDKSSENDVAWHDGDLTNALNSILARRVMRVAQSGVKGWPDTSPRFARLDDITCFIEGRINDALLADLIWGLSLLDWQQVKPSSPEFRETPEAIPSSFYAMLRLCFRSANGKDEAIPLVPAILHRAMNGDGKTASELAARRLRASGKAPLVDELPVAGDIARRTAAATLFPIAPQDFRLLERTVLKPLNTQNT
jgi:CRISPR-associated protein Csx17